MDSSILDLSCLYELHCGIFDLNDSFIRLVCQYLIYCGLFSLFVLGSFDFCPTPSWCGCYICQKLILIVIGKWYFDGRLDRGSLAVPFWLCFCILYCCWVYFWESHG